MSVLLFIDARYLMDHNVRRNLGFKEVTRLRLRGPIYGDVLVRRFQDVFRFLIGLYCDPQGQDVRVANHFRALGNAGFIALYRFVARFKGVGVEGITRFILYVIKGTRGDCVPLGFCPFV